MEKICKVSLIGLNSKLGSEITTAKKDAARNGVTKLYLLGEENLIDFTSQVVITIFKKLGTDISRIRGIFGSSNPTAKFLVPSFTACVASELGLKNIICDHIGLGCSGGLQALRNAYNQAIVDYTAGKIGYYLVIMGDQTSRLLDQNDFSTSFLFSEGAAAILLTNDQNEGRGYKIEKIGTKSLLGESIYDLRIKNPYDSLNKLGMIPKLKMNGLRVFQFAINIFPDILDLIGLKSMDKYTYFIPHQANLRIIKGIIKNNPNQLNPSNVYSDGIKNGNTSSASVFFGLNDSLKRGLFNQGYSVILGTFGAELQIGAALLLPQKEDLYVL